MPADCIDDAEVVVLDTDDAEVYGVALDDAVATAADEREDEVGVVALDEEETQL